MYSIAHIIEYANIIPHILLYGQHQAAACPVSLSCRWHKLPGGYYPSGWGLESRDTLIRTIQMTKIPYLDNLDRLDNLISYCQRIY